MKLIMCVHTDMVWNGVESLRKYAIALDKIKRTYEFCMKIKKTKSNLIDHLNLSDRLTK